MKKLNRLTQEELEALSSQKAESYLGSHLFVIGATGIVALFTASAVFDFVYKAAQAATGSPTGLLLFWMIIAPLGAFCIGMFGLVLSKCAGRSTGETAFFAFVAMVITMTIDGLLQTLTVQMFASFLDKQVNWGIAGTGIVLFQIAMVFSRAIMSKRPAKSKK